MFEHLTVNDLVRLAGAGGGFTVNAAQYQTNDLVRIAGAASNKGARVTFSNVTHLDVDSLIRIAGAGGGAATFV